MWIFIEGPGAVGKTTLSQYLQAHGWTVFDEILTIFATEGKEYVGLPSTPNRPFENQRWFLAREVDRFRQTLERRSSNCVLDRSYFSTLAYSYAFERYLQATGLYASTLADISIMLKAGDLPSPSLLVMVKADSRLRQQREAARLEGQRLSSEQQAYVDLHGHPDFAVPLEAYYRHLPYRLYSGINCLTVSGEMSPEMAYSQIVTCCSPRKNKTNLPFGAFVHRMLVDPQQWCNE